MVKVTNSTQTIELAKIIGLNVEPGDVIVLTGDLGAGKTTFTKGIAEGLGIHQMIKSPTYTIIREYEEGRIPLYHMDVYRVTEGIDDLDLDDYFEGEGISIVEWGNQLGEFLPKDYCEIIIEKENQNPDIRTLSIKAHGPRSEKFAASINKCWAEKMNE